MVNQLDQTDEVTATQVLIVVHPWSLKLCPALATAAAGDASAILAALRMVFAEIPAPLTVADASWLGLTGRYDAATQRLSADLPYVFESSNQSATLPCTASSVTEAPATAPSPFKPSPAGPHSGIRPKLRNLHPPCLVAGATAELTVDCGAAATGCGRDGCEVLVTTQAGELLSRVPCIGRRVRVDIHAYRGDPDRVGAVIVHLLRGPEVLGTRRVPVLPADAVRELMGGAVSWQVRIASLAL